MTRGTTWQLGSILLAAALAGCKAPPGDASPVRIDATRADRAAAAPVQLASPAPAVESAVTSTPVVHSIEPDATPTTISVAVDQEVRFVNHDAICHRFFSSSAPNDFELGLLRPGASAAIRFRQPGTVQAYCSLHQHEQVTICVSGAAPPSR